ncbi:hypothetical protein JKP88DRAFT_349972 [Tribonema minus]|uniref:SWIM-type domain-containing protein n=1 Tax=Tribonema minus TaxID=303371 RepID=A0A835YQQ2_9STRA|nr:hypothetical protein JKP88DRAFT_349972 [Tribonema minus]
MVTEYKFLAGKTAPCNVSDKDKRPLVTVHAAPTNNARIGGHRPDNTLELTEVGVDFAKAGRMDNQAFRMTLHCAGPLRRGQASGANCWRNPAGGRWCASTTRECEPGCKWLLNTKQAGHRCSVSLLITATIEQVVAKQMQVCIRGQHTGGNVAAVPVARLQRTLSRLTQDSIRSQYLAAPTSRTRAVMEAKAKIPVGEEVTGRNMPVHTRVSGMRTYSAAKHSSPLAGPFVGFNDTVTRFCLSLARPLASGCEVLYYKYEPGGILQLIFTKREALAVLAAQPVDFLVSDSKFDTAGEKPAFTMLGFPLPDRQGMQPLVGSISSMEDGDTTYRIARALQWAMPCRPNCTHGWEEGRTEDEYIRWRSCARKRAERAEVEEGGEGGEGGEGAEGAGGMRANVDRFAPMVQIDKSSTAREGFTRAGWKTAVCFFHLIRATLKNLEQRLGKRHQMLRHFDRAIRLLMRAAKERYQEALTVLLAMVEQWGKADLLGDANTDNNLCKYLFEALGGAGTLWEGMIGDAVGEGVRGFCGTNNYSESHFRVLDECLFFGRLNGRFQRLLEVFLGVTGTGERALGRTYYELFDHLLQQRQLAGGSRVRCAERRRAVNGSWLNCLGKVARPRGGPGGGDTEWFFVEAGVKNAIEPATPRRQMEPQPDKVPLLDANAVFADLLAVIKPDRAPNPQDGCYLVGVRLDPLTEKEVVTCTCAMYNRRGNRHDLCKHGLAALACREVERRGEAALEEQQQCVMQSCGNAERARSAATTDHNLYKACRESNWRVVRAILLEGRCARGGAALVVHTVTIAAGVACDIELEEASEAMCAQLEITDDEPAFLIWSGAVRGGCSWQPALPKARSLHANDVVYRVGNIEITDIMSARAAQAALADKAEIFMKRIDAIMACMDAHKESPRIMRWGLKAVAEACYVNEVYFQSLADVCQMMAEAVHTHRNQEQVQAAALEAMHMLGNESNEATRRFQEAGMCEAVAAIMRRYPANAELQDWGLRLLTVLLGADGVYATRFAEAGGCAAVVAALRAHRDFEELEEQAVRVIVALSSDSSACRSALGEAHAQQAVTEVVDYYKGSDSSETMFALLAMAKLMTNHRANVAAFGAAGACVAVAHVLATHKDGWERAMRLHALLAVQALCEDNLTNSTALGAAQVCGAVVELMFQSDFHDDRDAQWEGLKAAASLSSNNPTNAVALVAAGMCRATATALAVHAAQGKVVQQGLRVVANLSDNSSASPAIGAALGAAQMCKAVVTGMLAHSGNAEVLLEGLRAVVSLSSDDPANSAALGEAGACNTVEAARQLPDASAELRVWGVRAVASLSFANVANKRAFLAVAVTGAAL